MNRVMFKCFVGFTSSLLGSGLLACSPEKEVAPTLPVVSPPGKEPLDIDSLSDTYAALALMLSGINGVLIILTILLS